jgi:hypothetical protein
MPASAERVRGWLGRPRGEENELRRLAVEIQAGRKRKQGMEKMSETVSQTWEDWVLQRGITQGEIASCRESLLVVLEERFGKLPAKLVKKIKATADLAKLKTAHRQAVHIDSPDELPL